MVVCELADTAATAAAVAVDEGGVITHYQGSHIQNAVERGFARAAD